MTSSTYYFMFSLVLVLSGAFCLLNLLLLRKGKTIFGITVKPGTLAFRRGTKLASKRNIAIIATLTVVFIGNLIYSINRLLNAEGYSPGLLLFLASFIVLIGAVIFPFMRKQARDIYESSRAVKQR